MPSNPVIPAAPSGYLNRLWSSAQLVYAASLANSFMSPVTAPPRMRGDGTSRAHSARSYRRALARQSARHARYKAEAPIKAGEPWLSRVSNMASQWMPSFFLPGVAGAADVAADLLHRPRLGVAQFRQAIGEQFTFDDGGIPGGDLKGRLVVVLYDELDSDDTMAMLQEVMRHARLGDRLAIGDLANHPRPQRDLSFGLPEGAYRHMVEHPLNAIPYTEADFDLMGNSVNLTNFVRLHAPGLEPKPDQLPAIKKRLDKASKQLYGEDRQQFRRMMADAIRMLELSREFETGFPARKKNLHHFLREADANVDPERTFFLAIPRSGLKHPQELAAGLAERHAIVVEPVQRKLRQPGKNHDDL